MPLMQPLREEHAELLPRIEALRDAGDALASVEGHMVPSRQGQVAAWRVGDGPAVLLVHGYADDQAARAAVEAAVGRDRAAFDSRQAFLALDQEVLVVQSVDDERIDVMGTAEFVSRNPRVRLVTVDGLSARRTARDPQTVEVVAAFVCQS